MNDLSIIIDLSASLYIGLVDGQGRCLASRVRDQGIRGESAHALLEECLETAGAESSSITRIAVGAGPGSFTGIRVGVALAQGLAFPRRLPIHPYSSLSAMLACAPEGEKPALAAIAANAGRFFAASLGRPASPARPAASDPPWEALLTAGEIAARAPDHGCLITSGFGPRGGAFPGNFGSRVRMEEAVDFSRIWSLAASRPPVRDGVIRPNYLMASAAEDKRHTAASVTSVRPMLAADLPEVLAIEADTNPMPWSPKDFQGFLPVGAPPREAGLPRVGNGVPTDTTAGGRKKGWVWADPRVRGFACAVGAADELELQAIAVATGDCGRGVGSGLMRALLDWARSEGYRSVHLEVREGNLRAQGFYAKWGFTQSGRRPHYYPDSREDALLFSLAL